MKNTKRNTITAIVLALTLLIVPDFSINASAATKLKPQKKTVAVGKTIKITLSGKNKTVKWSTSNKNIKIVKKAKKFAKIKGIKVGKSVLRAKVGKKTYKCNITIKQKKTENDTKSTPTVNPIIKPTEKPNIEPTLIPTEQPTVRPTGSPTNQPTVTPTENPAQTPTSIPEQTNEPLQTDNPNETPEPTNEPVDTTFNKANAEKSLKRDVEILNNKIVVFLENQYSMPVSVTSDCYFYDKEENVVDTGFTYLYQIEPGMKGALIFNETDEEYDHYELQYDVFQSFAYIDNKSIVSDIYIKHNEVFDDGELTGIALTVMNQSDYDCSCCTFMVKYYDDDGNIVDVKQEREYDIYSKRKEVIDISYPINYKTYQKVQYSSYDIELSTAYY